MKTFLSILLVTVFSAASMAQPGDFMVIKKNGQTFKTFFTGAYITFQTNTGNWYNTRITDIKNDSLFFKEVIVRQVATPWGVPRLDTITNMTRRIFYKDVTAVPRKKESFTYIKDGTILMLGGGGYVLLNVINSSYLHYPVLGKKNLPGFLTAAGVFGTGFLMKKLYKPYIILGKKYTMEYVKLKSG